MKIPENLETGIYIVSLESGGLIHYSQKISIIK